MGARKNGEREGGGGQEGRKGITCSLNTKHFTELRSPTKGQQERDLIGY